MKLSLVVVEQSSAVAEYELSVGASAKLVKVRPGQHFVLLDQATGRAPQSVVAIRKGQQLVLRSGLDAASAELIALEGFYGDDGVGASLVGLDESNQYYHFVSTGERPGELVASLADNGSTPLALGGDSLGEGAPFAQAGFEEQAVPLLVTQSGFSAWLAGGILAVGAGLTFFPQSKRSSRETVVLEVRDDVGPQQGVIASGETTDDAKPTFSGVGVAGATVIVYDNGKAVGQATVKSDGAWIFAPDTPWVEGSHEITITIFDPIGNGPVSSLAYSFIVDTTPDESIRRMTDRLMQVGGTDAQYDVVQVDLAGETINLGQMSSIEKVDLSGSGANKMSVSLKDVLNISTDNTALQYAQTALKVVGDLDDTVDLVNGATDQWVADGQVTSAGVVYNVYHNSAATDPLADVWVKDQIHVNIV